MAKVLISMKEEFLSEIDKLADDEHRSRSELIREALRLYIKARAKSTVDVKQVNNQAKLIENLLLD